MTVTGPSPPPPPALAVPDEGRGLPVPVAGRLLEPGADLGRAPRLLPLERPALEDALDRFGHVQPAAAHLYYERWGWRMGISREEPRRVTGGRDDGGRAADAPGGGA